MLTSVIFFYFPKFFVFHLLLLYCHLTPEFLNFCFVFFLHGDDGFIYIFLIHGEILDHNFHVFLDNIFSEYYYLSMGFGSFLEFSFFNNSLFGCCVLASSLLFSTKAEDPIDLCSWSCGRSGGKGSASGSGLSSLLLQILLPPDKFFLRSAAWSLLSCLRKPSRQICAASPCYWCHRIQRYCQAHLWLWWAPHFLTPAQLPGARPVHRGFLLHSLCLASPALNSAYLDVAFVS